MPCAVGIVHLIMHLLLDIGNSRIKFGIVAEGSIEASGIVDPGGLDELLASMPFDGVAVCATGAKPSIDHAFVLNALAELPFRNKYQSETLGPDRMALVAGAQSIYPSRNVLILDFGTCLTADFIDDSGTYHGGSISPGLQMRYDAMHSFTEKLPQFSNGQQYAIPLTGEDTEGSIRSGAVNGLRFEAMGVIQDYQSRYSDLITVLTGGDHGILEVAPKNNIFAHENLLLKGLDVIFLLNRSARENT